MKNYIIICGLNDKDTRKQEITTEQAKTTLATIILNYADGATLTECNGIYKHEDGGIVFEKSIKIEISGISKENAERIASRAPSIKNQYILRSLPPMFVLYKRPDESRRIATK